MEQNRLLEAQRAIDNLLGNPRNQRFADAWYLKARIYAGLLSEGKTQSLPQDGRRQALDAIRKALEVDRNQALMLLTVEEHQTAFSLYTSGLRQGVDLYNTQMYEPSLSAFRETALTGEYIFSQGWGLTRIDTSLTLYTGLAAYRAGRQEEAILQFRKLADAEVGGGAEYASPYRYLAKYCYDRKDAANLARYLSIGMRLFPNDEYLMLTDIEATRDSRDYKSLFQKYERLLTVFPDRYDAMMEYANELFGYTHSLGNARTQPDYVVNCARIEDLFNRSISLRPESEEAWLSLGKHFYNQALLCYEEVSRNTGKNQEDRQLKSQQEQQVSKLAEKAIQPLEKVFSRLDGRKGLREPESSYYQSACSLLSYCHEMRKDFSKSELYRNKFESAKQHRNP
ncbi:MAG: hypothetical protein EBZ67_02475 [Chitinophagia bacterium]|nr:hypothetical protein [Chitinophagia bacterium]